MLAMSLKQTPRFRVELAPDNWFKCHGPKPCAGQPIIPGEVRFGVAYVYKSHSSFSWYHMNCVPDKMWRKVVPHLSEPYQLDGFADLPTKLKDVVSRAFSVARTTTLWNVTRENLAETVASGSKEQRVLAETTNIMQTGLDNRTGGSLSPLTEYVVGTDCTDYHVVGNVEGGKPSVQDVDLFYAYSEPPPNTPLSFDKTVEYNESKVNLQDDVTMYESEVFSGTTLEPEVSHEHMQVLGAVHERENSEPDMQLFTAFAELLANGIPRGTIIRQDDNPGVNREDIHASRTTKTNATPCAGAPEREASNVTSPDDGSTTSAQLVFVLSEDSPLAHKPSTPTPTRRPRQGKFAAAVAGLVPRLRRLASRVRAGKIKVSDADMLAEWLQRYDGLCKSGVKEPSGSVSASDEWEDWLLGLSSQLEAMVGVVQQGNLDVAVARRIAKGISKFI